MTFAAVGSLAQPQGPYDQGHYAITSTTWTAGPEPVPSRFLLARCRRRGLFYEVTTYLNNHSVRCGVQLMTVTTMVALAYR